MFPFFFSLLHFRLGNRRARVQEKEKAELLRIRKEYFRQRLALSRERSIARQKDKDGPPSKLQEVSSKTGDEEEEESEYASSHKRHSKKDLVLMRKKEKQEKEEEVKKKNLTSERKSYFNLRKRLHDLKYVPSSLVVAWFKRRGKKKKALSLPPPRFKKPISKSKSIIVTCTKSIPEDKVIEDESSEYITASSKLATPPSKLKLSKSLSEKVRRRRTMPTKSVTTTKNSTTTMPLRQEEEGDEEKEEEEEEDDDDEENTSRETLAQQWFEVSCLLRHDFANAKDYESGIDRVKKSLSFLNRLDRVAERIDVNRGQIFQGLLRRIDDSTTVMMCREDGTYDAYTAKIKAASDVVNEKDWTELTNDARDVLNLVRIKLEDKNDLETARSALEHSNTFFGDVSNYASKKSVPAYSVISEL